jgi:hypothetical protein
MEGSVKRILAAAALAAPLALVPGIAQATGGTTSTNSIYIYPSADYGLNGATLDLDLQVKCKTSTGNGVINLTAEQYYPETPDPLGAYGIGATLVVCDGKSRPVAGSVEGAVFDNGKAKATASLVGSSTTTTKWITIIAH